MRITGSEPSYRCPNLREEKEEGDCVQHVNDSVNLACLTESQEERRGCGVVSFGTGRILHSMIH